MGRKSLKQVYGESWERGETQRVTIRIPKQLLDDKPEDQTISTFVRRKLFSGIEVSDNKILIKKLIDLLGEVEIPEDYFTPEEIKTMQEVAEIVENG